MPVCPECNSSKTWRDGLRYVQDQFIQRYICRGCGYRFSENANNEIQQSRNCQICVTLTEDTKNLTRTEQKQVLRENHKYTAIIEQFKWYMQRKEYSKETIKLRDYHLNRLVELKADLDDPETVETVLVLSGWSKAYKKIIVGSYKAYCKWRKIFWDAPRIHVSQKIIKLPSEEDVKLLIAGLGKKTSTLCQLLYETGCRIGEACKLRWNDVDWKKHKIHINLPEKRGNSRIVNVSSKLLSMLKALPKRADGYIFNPKARTHDSGFNRSRNRLAEKLQKPELEEIHFHTFRHLRATLELYTKGKHHRDVQYMLGHRSSQSTDRYTHYRPQAPTKWETRRVTTREEEDQLIEENWIFHRYDELHKEAIYRRVKSQDNL